MRMLCVPHAVTRQGFEAIAGWRLQKVERRCTVQHLQFPLCYRLEGREVPGLSALEQKFRLLALERLDHVEILPAYR